MASTGGHLLTTQVLLTGSIPKGHTRGALQQQQQVNHVLESTNSHILAQAFKEGMYTGTCGHGLSFIKADGANSTVYRGNCGEVIEPVLVQITQALFPSHVRQVQNVHNSLPT
jgi:hypothetical protein